MKYKLGSLTRYLVLFVITLSLLWFAFRGIDLNKLFSEILRAKISWVALSGIFSLVAFLVRGYRWKLLIEPLGYSPSLKNTTYSVMIGYFANLALARLGEVTRCGALSKTESIPFNKLLGTVIVERLIDVLSLIICILLAAAIEYKRLGDFFYEKIFNPLAEKLKLVMRSPLLLALLILLMIVLIGFAIYFFRKSKGSESKVTRLIIGFVDGLKSIGRLKRPWAFIFQSAFYGKINRYLFTQPQSLQFDKVIDTIHLQLQRYKMLRYIIRYIPHNIGKFHDTFCGMIAFGSRKGVNIIKRIK